MEKRTQLSKFKESVSYPSYPKDSVFIAISDNQFAYGWNEKHRIAFLHRVNSTEAFKNLATKYQAYNDNVSVHSSLDTLITDRFPTSTPIQIIELDPKSYEIRSEFTVKDKQAFIQNYKLSHLEDWAKT